MTLSSDIQPSSSERPIKRTGLTLAALGGPQTFNAMAAARLVEHFPEFGEVVYFPTSDAVIEAAVNGVVDAACGQEQTSMNGFHVGMQARMSAPDSRLYVVAEIAQRYRCSLLCKPGAPIEAVLRVLGHNGSIAHSRGWLERHLPTASIEVVTTNSLGAAREVLDGDGAVASVGSPALAQEFGLEERVRGIDDGSVVNYWAVSLRPLFSETPDRLALAWRCGEDAAMTGLVFELGEAGFQLQAVYPRPTGGTLYEYDYVFRFRGLGSLANVRTAIAPYSGARLAGAWNARAEVQ